MKKTERIWGAGIIIGSFLLRLLFISTTMVLDDEAYYYVWAKHLSAGYLDGGPTIAYVIKVFISLFGANGMSVRLGAVVLVALLQVYLWLWSTRRFGSVTGFLLLLFTTVTPLCFVSSIVHTYDTEMAAFMLAAIALYYDAFFVNSRMFYLAGIALGLAVLSKIPVLFSACGIYALPFFVRELRHVLRQKEFYLSAVIVGLVFSPFIYWNLVHDMAFVSYKGSLAFRGGALGDFLGVWGAQVGLFMPILFWFAIFLPFRILTNYLSRRNVSPKDMYFALIAIFPILYFFIGSLFSRYYANWVAPAFFGGLFLTAIHFGRRWPRYRAIAAAQVISSTAIFLLIISQVYFDYLPLPVGSDPTSRYYIYSAIPGELKTFLHDHPEYESIRIVGTGYQIPSLVNLYIQPKLEAVALSLGGYHTTEYAILYPRETLAGESFLYLEKKETLPEKIRLHFKTVEKIRTFTSLRNGREAALLTLWYVTGFDGAAQ